METAAVTFTSFARGSCQCTAPCCFLARKFMLVHFAKRYSTLLRLSKGTGGYSLRTPWKRDSLYTRPVRTNVPRKKKKSQESRMIWACVTENCFFLVCGWFVCNNNRWNEERNTRLSHTYRMHLAWCAALVRWGIMLAAPSITRTVGREKVRQENLVRGLVHAQGIPDWHSKQQTSNDSRLSYERCAGGFE